MSIKTAQAQYVRWPEVLNIIDSETLTDVDGWLDELLEALETGEGVVTVSRVSTVQPNLQRSSTKTAANFDKEFEAVQAHARSVLANLGNLR